MDKNQAGNLIVNEGMSSYDIAHSIYLATVKGVSGAKQNEGYGFALSAIAELWNIRGNVKNPMAGKTTITGRYRNMGITEERILRIIKEYPNGMNGEYPLFDELLLSADAGNNRQPQTQIPLQETTTRSSYDSGSNADAEDRAGAVVFVIALVITKFILHMGWVAAIILSILLAGVAITLVSRRR